MCSISKRQVRALALFVVNRDGSGGGVMGLVAWSKFSPAPSGRYPERHEMVEVDVPESTCCSRVSKMNLAGARA